MSTGKHSRRFSLALSNFKRDRPSTFDTEGHTRKCPQLNDTPASAARDQPARREALAGLAASARRALEIARRMGIVVDMKDMKESMPARIEISVHVVEKVVT